MPPWVPSLVVGVGGLVWGIWSWLRAERRKLSIQQHGDNIINTAYHRAEFSTLFMLDVSVTNDSPKRTIVISHYDLELPWNDPDVRPLSDPAETEQTLYRFSDTLIEYPRDIVVNHRRLDLGKLNAGDTIKGLFMARGRAPIPRDLYTGEWIPVNFVVVDTEGKRYVEKMGLWPMTNWPPGPSEPHLPLPDYTLEAFDAYPEAVIDPRKSE